MNTTANRELFRETMRYRRRLLSNLRTRRMREAAEQIRETGRIKGSTKRRLRNTERQIREFNDLATELGLATIRT